MEMEEFIKLFREAVASGRIAVRVNVYPKESESKRYEYTTVVTDIEVDGETLESYDGTFEEANKLF